MSCIDLENHEPFYLKINMHGYQVVTMVRPIMANISLSTDTQYAWSCGEKLISYKTNPEVNIDISFNGIPNSKNRVITYIKKNN